jgi:serpin B
MMRQKSSFRMLNQETWQVIDLPYATGMSMTILLPKQRQGLAAAEAKLDAAGLAAVLKALDAAREDKVDLSLPKFKLSTEYDLVSPLESFGIKDAFDASVADFTPMGYPKSLAYISQVMHKAVVEVGEKGTEAAAVTAVEMSVKSLPPPTPTFTADHPFLFLIRDPSTSTILFMGRLTHPAAETGD